MGNELQDDGDEAAEIFLLELPLSYDADDANLATVNRPASRSALSLGNPAEYSIMAARSSASSQSDHGRSVGGISFTPLMSDR